MPVTRNELENVRDLLEHAKFATEAAHSALAILLSRLDHERDEARLDRVAEALAQSAREAQ